MRKAIVTIVGDSPLLMHNPIGMRGPHSGRKEIPTPEQEAAQGCYWMPDKSSLMIPAYMLHAGLVKAASGFRITGRRSVVPYIAGSVEVQPEFIPIGTKKYEIDTRSVVIQRQRILRSRAKVWPWKAIFELHYDEEFLNKEFMENSMPQLLKTLGAAIGLMDYRPSQKGRFGKFHIGEYKF